MPLLTKKNRAMLDRITREGALIITGMPNRTEDHILRHTAEIWTAEHEMKRACAMAYIT